MSEAQVTELKEKGNAALQAGRASEAVDAYGAALALCAEGSPQLHILLSNRSSAYLKQKKNAEALLDAERCVKVNAQWSKGYLRLAQALHALHRFKDALQAASQGLKLEPGNALLVAQLSDSQREQRRIEAEETLVMLQEAFKGDVLSRARMYPETRAFCDDPDFVDNLVALKKNPERIEEVMRLDQKIATYASVAVEYQKLEKMSPEERDRIFKRQAEQMEREAKMEAERDERERQGRKRRELEEAARKKAEEESKLSPQQKEARAFKEEGNALFKKKDFQAALDKYEQAAAADPLDVTLLTNQAAVLLEMERYGEAIATCEKALELGRQVKAPFSAMARAYQRIGSAHMRTKHFAGAVEAYKKSLTEERTAETLALLRKAETALSEAERAAYLDPALGAQAKEEGNALFKVQKFPEAIERYTEAIKWSPSDHTYYTNRATAYTKLMAYPEALKDLDKAIALKPDFIKAYLKKGHIHQVLKEYQKCLETYDKALKFDPDNKEVEQATAHVIQLINSGQGDELDKEAVARNVSKDPELQRILRDPVMQQALQDMQNDPSAMSRYMADPQIMANINKLIAAGVIRTR